MTNRYVKYQISDGRILGITSVNDNVVSVHNKKLAETGKSLLEFYGDLNPERDYVHRQEVKKRPVANLSKSRIKSDGQDSATLSNLPDPCTVRVNGSVHEVTGGKLVITASKPADYLIEIRDNDAFPLQAFKTTVGAS